MKKYLVVDYNYSYINYANAKSHPASAGWLSIINGSVIIY